MRPGRAVASFDSATGMLRALSRFLAGQDVPVIGQAPAWAEPAMSALLGGVNRLPRPVTERLYAVSGIAEAVPQSSVGRIRSDALASWVVDHYPKRRYPVVFVGSTNGALMHLAAALDAPWLPQTLLIPVRRKGVDRDDPEAEMEAGYEPGRALLEANPDLVLHHMHDPNQDRLMIAGMSYFRVKWRRLPAPYQRFLRDHLDDGGIVVSVECGQQWPVTRVGDRHLFQFGGYGGATQEEYHSGGTRVADLLMRYGAHRRSWHPPAPDEQAPEAEWGYEPGLLDDLESFVRDRDRSLKRLRFDAPDDLSPPVANLYRSWYEERGIPADRLLAECFLLLDPWWTLRTGSVPYWMVFNTESSRRALESYLDDRVFDEIRVMLFSHGTDSIGLAHIDDWQASVGRARKSGTLLGADLAAYPRDFAGLVRAHRELARTPNRHEMPEPLPFSKVASLFGSKLGRIT